MSDRRSSPSSFFHPSSATRWSTLGRSREKRKPTEDEDDGDEGGEKDERSAKKGIRQNDHFGIYECVSLEWIKTLRGEKISSSSLLPNKISFHSSLSHCLLNMCQLNISIKLCTKNLPRNHSVTTPVQNGPWYMFQESWVCGLNVAKVFDSWYKRQV